MGGYAALVGAAMVATFAVLTVLTAAGVWVVLARPAALESAGVGRGSPSPDGPAAR